ncbi:cation transporter [Mycoplasmopsis pullorum]|uniref:potassium transporter TrkG n=1 Tax=Mycoplasmopsis pullorum TaxID=48003 RepID=UPI001119C1B6|nr:potassium transporter TrkG [Mycoplasmopsis pullorum]TNK82493.1 cation transporter [Mycoplasmopsis pullorum]TNK83268.1 cation transporter [Mycoplasmopsis pullorum]TNK84971.1 cation transporter [Mycoplasmopsis pullorum]TNK85560.1 cation transporter [Mycoplasmopsis pullorum]TNK86059.1 cation transporter [Mycoplasmopsis pullorum]
MNWKNFNIIRKKLGTHKYILLIYLLIVILASLLLYSPWTQNTSYLVELTGKQKAIPRISYINALFITASAFSDTGLVVVDTFRQWNMFGQSIIAILILVGGIGVFALKLFLINWLFRRKTTTLSEIKLINNERGSDDIAQTFKLVVTAVKFLLLVCLIFGFILTFYFYFVGPEHPKDFVNPASFINPKGNWSMSFRFGFFHSISALNNAGFDILGENSFMPYYLNYGLQAIFIILLLIGGLGYPTIYDIYCFIVHKITGKKNKYHFSLFSKVSLTTYLLVTIFGFLLISLTEILSNSNNTFWNMEMNGSIFAKSFALFFCSLSTRSAGFSFIDMSQLNSNTALILLIMMFIGAAPASTGGGIRTTTFAIIVAMLFNKILGKPRTRMFKRTISLETEKQALLVFVISIFLLIIISLICSTSFESYGGNIKTHYSKVNDGLQSKEDQYFSMTQIIFEVSSAFGTTGLSTGMTKYFNIESKIALTLLMFIGQFGISSTILVWGFKNYSNKFEYVQSDLTTG